MTISSNSATGPVGFRPLGDGPPGRKYGRTPDGLAYKSDGTPRAPRRTFTPLEKRQRIRESEAQQMAGVGRAIVKEIPALESVRAHIGTYRKWARDAKAYGTPEARAERRSYFERMLDVIDAKGEAAEKWLPQAGAALDVADGLYTKAGVAFMEFMDANDNAAPDAAQSEAIISRLLTPAVRTAIESAANPENDPFAAFRRDAGEPETAADLEEAQDS